MVLHQARNRTAFGDSLRLCPRSYSGLGVFPRDNEKTKGFCEEIDIIEINDSKNC